MHKVQLGELHLGNLVRSLYKELDLTYMFFIPGLNTRDKHACAVDFRSGAKLTK